MINHMNQQNNQGIDRRSLLVRGGAVAAGAIGATVAGVATAAPALAAGLGFTPITSYRSYDSRFDPAGKLPAGFFGVLQLITDEDGAPRVPTTAQAVTFNLTITQTEGSGFLGVVPADAPESTWTVSNINWGVPNLDLANGGTTRIAFHIDAGPGSVVVYCDGFPNAQTHFIIDVTGYFAP
jgi:hypothetical protein